VLNLFWENADVMTPNDMYLSVSFRVMSNKASIFIDRNTKLEEAEILKWSKSDTPRTWRAETATGEIWEVVKLRCKCLDPAKSGRIWT
jgi:hypothetical protein